MWSHNAKQKSSMPFIPFKKKKSLPRFPIKKRNQHKESATFFIPTANGHGWTGGDTMQQRNISTVTGKMKPY